MLSPNDVYKKVADSWVSRFILDEVVIMPLCRSEEDVQYIYSISNETGSRIWQLIDGSHSVKVIQEILKSEYEGPAEVIKREVLEFIKDLLEAKLIKKSGQGMSTGSSSPQSPTKKKVWKTPEIAKVKMQPEQAVLSCCNNTVVSKRYWADLSRNICKFSTCDVTQGPTTCDLNNSADNSIQFS